MVVLPALRFKKTTDFQYRVTLGNMQGDTTPDADAIPEKVADESRVAVRELPFLDVPAQAGDFLDVVVSHVETYDRVYVQLLNEVAALARLNTNLQRYFAIDTNQKQLINPHRAQICAVKSPEGEQYYRAAVIRRPNPVDVELYCVDYGMKLTLHKEQILVLADEFKGLPPQAIAVKIGGVTDSSIKISLSEFKNFLEKKPVTLRMEAHLEDKYVVSMTFEDQKSAGVNISDILTGAVSTRGQGSTTNWQPPSAASSHSLASSSAFGAGLSKNCGSDPNQFSLAQSMTNQRLNEELPSKQIDVLVDRRQPIVGLPSYPLYPSPPLSHAASSTALVTKLDPAVVSFPAHEVCGRSDDNETALPSRFFVHLAQFADKVVQMCAEIKQPTTSLQESAIGTPCIANYQGGWYRAEVTAINGNTLTVQYVDFGNSETKQQNEVFAITDEQPEIVRTSHKLAIPCKLVDVEPMDGNEWSSASIAVFHAAFPEECSGAHIHIEGQDEDGVYLVKLEVRNFPVSASLVLENVAKSRPASAYVAKIASAVVATPVQETAMRCDDNTSGSAARFYVQLGRFAEKVQQMLTEIRQPTVVLDRPAAGMACIANFAGGWYRAEIVAVNNDSAVVQYVDYGNTETKKLNELYLFFHEQSEFVRTTHKLAIPCKLLSLNGKEWSPTASIESFQDALPEECTIQLKIKRQEDDLYLADVQMAELAAAAVAESESAVRVTKFDPAVLYLPVQEMCTRSDDNKSSKPSRFFVQLERFYSKVQQMGEEIKQPTVLLDRPEIGMACIANYLGDWYRAEVIDIEEFAAIVQYVDYGNVERKGFDQLYAVTEEQSEFVRNTQKLAVPCKLTVDPQDGKEWSLDSIIKFQTIFPEECTAHVSIEGQEKYGVFLADLKAGESSVAELLVAQQVAKKHCPLVVADEVTKIESAVVATPVLEAAVRSDDNSSGSAEHFYVQLYRFADKVNQMITEIKEPTVVLKQPTLGTACIANFAGDWYRAEIVAVNDQKVTVQFVDYGNVEAKLPNEVFAITSEQPEIVRTSHKLAIPCKLVHTKEWSPELFNAKFPEFSSLQLDIMGQEGEVFLVDMKEFEASVAEPHVVVDTATDVPAASNVTEIAAAVISVPVQEMCTRSDDDVSSTPARFFVQLERFYDKIRQMGDEIKQPTVVLDRPAAGMACIANFAGGWYRAEIVLVDKDLVVVEYVDYGNMEAKQPNEVFAITDEQPEIVRTSHKLAIPCKLLGIEPADGNEWSNDSIKLFHASFAEGCSTAQVDIEGQEENGVFLVELKVDESSVAESLVAQKAAKNLCLPAASNLTEIAAAVISVPVQEMCTRSDDVVSSTPARFFVQLERFYDKIQQMSDEIKQPTTVLDRPAAGMACIANFAGGWYRAEIVAVDNESVVVEYVDYGNSETKQKSEVFAITDEQPEIVRTSHKLAIPCKLVDLEEWSTESFQTEFPETSTYQVDVSAQDGELFLVRLMKV